MRDDTEGTKYQFSRRFEVVWCHQKASLKKLMWTCLIEQVIPPRVEDEAQCVHYASEASTGLFWNASRMNLGPVKPCTVRKGTEWLKNNCNPIGKLISLSQNSQNILLYYYILHHSTSQLPGPRRSCRHRDVHGRFAWVTSWYYYKDASHILRYISTNICVLVIYVRRWLLACM